MRTFTSSQWASLIRPGERIYVAGGTVVPNRLILDLADQSAVLPDTEVVLPWSPFPRPWFSRLLEGHARPVFLSPAFGPDPTGSLMQAERFPLPVWRGDEILRDRHDPTVLALLTVSEPDTRGRCTVLPDCGHGWAAARNARAVVAVIKPGFQSIAGACELSLDRMHATVTCTTPLPDWAPGPLYPASYEPIGPLVSEWISDGVTLHIDPSPLGELVLESLQQHQALRLHTFALTPGMQRLAMQGVLIAGEGDSGQGMGSACGWLGNASMHRWVAGRPPVRFLSLPDLAHPHALLRNPKPVAVLCPSRLPLDGPLPADGSSPLADAWRCARLSGSAFVVLTLPSRLPDGTSSFKWVNGGGLGTGALSWVDALATEYGLAFLGRETESGRITEAISLAHPEHRESLLAEARRRRMVSGSWAFPPPPPSDAASMTCVLKDGLYRLRALTPGDDYRLQRFFYSHNDETVHRRYGFTVRRMSREKAIQMVGVDQNRDVAYGIFEVAGGHEVLHAVGRYFLDPTGEAAEMAFVTRETKRQLGMARALLVRIMEVAEGRGLRFLWAQVDRDNLPMLTLLREYGARTLPSREVDAIQVRLPLNDVSSAGDLRRKGLNDDQSGNHGGSDSVQS